MSKFKKLGILALVGGMLILTSSQSNSAPSQQQTVEDWCKEVSESVKSLKWKVQPCEGIRWQGGGYSVQGRPLVYAEFGDPKAENTTLILSTVHGDEITPLYLGLQLAQWLKERQGELIKTRVIIAPLVNPDGFFRKPKTRMNARGVDVNRNFPTKDWHRLALAAWKKKYHSNPRRFPGNEPMSEPETQFQEELIRKLRPQKILSIHSPLNFLDYDGPSKVALSEFPSEYTRVCEQLKRRLRASSSGFFPGSLGNFAGRELGIPTLTLELPSADPNKADIYWKKFSQGIRTMIQFTVPSYASGKLNASSGS
jgi:protein MpaA